MKPVKAINPKHQAKINKASKLLTRYYFLNDLRDNAENDGNTKDYNKLNRQCEIVFEKYIDVVNELPKREQTNFEKKYHE